MEPDPNEYCRDCPNTDACHENQGCVKLKRPSPSDAADCSGFFIVNRYDRPSEEHIAERREDGYLYYVHQNLRNEKRYWAMNPDDPTPLEDFGIHIMIEGGNLHGKLVDPSRATYLDGRVRKWQGSEEFCFDYPIR